MIFTEVEEIKGLWVIEPKIFEDERGYFFESFRQEEFEKYISGVKFVQENESFSTYGVLRGMHYQKEPFAQSKLVRVVKGEVQDVALDLRKNSPTYGKHYSIILSDENKKQFFIPKGFAHGYLVLSKEAIFQYKVDECYNKKSEGGVNFQSQEINWLLRFDLIKINQKDLTLKLMNKHFDY